MPAARTTAPIARWLVKSEPDAFSWDQQVANGVEPWTGVRNHLAKKNLMAMKKGDLAFFYHSNIGKEVVGVVEVAREDEGRDAVADRGHGLGCGVEAEHQVVDALIVDDVYDRPGTADEQDGVVSLERGGLRGLATAVVVLERAQEIGRGMVGPLGEHL
jgi:hypothetical protein